MFPSIISDGIESCQAVYDRLGEIIPAGIFKLKPMNGDSFKIKICTEKCT